MPRYSSLSPASQGLSANVYQKLREAAEHHAPEVFALNVGDTYRAAPACAYLEPLSEGGARAQYGYAPVQGDPALLDAFEARLAQSGEPPPREQMLVTAGATHGLTLAASALLTAGDELLLPSPYWPLIRGITTSVGASPVEVPLFTTSMDPDSLTDQLESAVTERTAALYLNTPHNPTGTVLTDAHLEALGEFVTRHDLWVLCDQAYEELIFDPAARARPAFRHPGLRERAVVAHTLSKSYGLAGARLGLLHGPAAAMAAIRALSAFQVYCVARPMQAAGARTLSSPEAALWLEEARAAYAVAASKGAQTLGLSAPQSGTFLFFDTTPLRRDGEDAAGFLERCARAGLVLTDGKACGQAYSQWARLCFTAVPPDKLERALNALRQVLAPTGLQPEPAPGLDRH